MPRAKKCDYCGKEYPDEVERCPIDGNPLQTIPSVSPAPAPATEAPKPGNPIKRAAVVSGIIFVIGLVRLVRILPLGMDVGTYIMLASLFLVCLVTVGVVAVLSRGGRSSWSWPRVIVVTLGSYIGIGSILLAAGFGLGFIAKALKQ